MFGLDPRRYIVFILGFALVFCSSISQIPMNPSKRPAQNVLLTELQSCCIDPMTGFYRNGSCETGPEDHGTHVVCARMTEEFLTYTKAKGNDLSTPRPEYHFPGLKPGDQWCLCALRWQEAFEAGMAPPVVLESTYLKALKYIQLEDLQTHALQK